MNNAAPVCLRTKHLHQKTLVSVSDGGALRGSKDDQLSATRPKHGHVPMSHCLRGACLVANRRYCSVGIPQSSSGLPVPLVVRRSDGLVAYLHVFVPHHHPACPRSIVEKMALLLSNLPSSFTIRGMEPGNMTNDDRSIYAWLPDLASMLSA